MLRIARSSGSEEGTASVELIGVLPFLLLVILVVAQLGLAGQALWASGIAARAGARAALVGSDAEAAARRALPPSMRTGASVTDDDAVSVRVLIPRIVPGLPPLSVGASTRLAAGGG